MESGGQKREFISQHTPLIQIGRVHMYLMQQLTFIHLFYLQSQPYEIDISILT